MITTLLHVLLNFTKVSRSPKVGLPISGNLCVRMSVGLPISGRLRLSSRRLLANLKYYQTDVCWQISNTIKQTSVGKCQILSSRRLLANLKYYQVDDVNLSFELELKFLSNG